MPASGEAAVYFVKNQVHRIPPSVRPSPLCWTADGDVESNTAAVDALASSGFGDTWPSPSEEPPSTGLLQPFQSMDAIGLPPDSRESRSVEITPSTLVYQSAAPRWPQMCQPKECHRRQQRVPFVSAVRGQVSLPFMGTPPPIEIANLGMADSLILMVMALVVFGPRRLPQIGRQIGKLMYEFRKASNDFKFQMEEELRNAEEADRRKKEEERLKALAATIAPSRLRSRRIHRRR